MILCLKSKTISKTNLLFNFTEAQELSELKKKIKNTHMYECVPFVCLFVNKSSLFIHPEFARSVLGPQCTSKGMRT